MREMNKLQAMPGQNVRQENKGKIRPKIKKKI